MEIQWSLVLFTALTGLGSWMFVCIAADEFLQKAREHAFVQSVVAFAVVVVGGFASITHLSHIENILGALSHPTSGIFIEAVLTGLLCAAIAIFALLVKREAGDGARKAVAVIGAVLGVALSFMVGESYLMASHPNWCTQLLPVGYMLTAIPAGISAFLTVAIVKKPEGEYKQYYQMLVIAAALACIGAVAYTAVAGAVATAIVPLLIAVVGVGAVPAAAGILVGKKPDQARNLLIVSLACATIGAIAYRVIMWVGAVPIADLFRITF